MVDIRNKKITILGAQRSGIALARLINDLGGIPRISDKMKESDLSDSAKDEIKRCKIDCEFGIHSKAYTENTDMLVLSPGVSINAEIIVSAKKKNIPVVGEIEFAFQFCTKPVIAVTGSNGKTTVVTLIDQILKKAGFKSCLCGNVGFPFSDFVLKCDEIDYFVLEVSSFQMESVSDKKKVDEIAHLGFQNFKGFKPHLAVLLNFSQNHLDRHKDLVEYLSAKARIFINQGKEDYAILSEDNSCTEFLVKTIHAPISYFNSAENKAKIGNPNYCAALEVAKSLNISGDICHDVFNAFKGVEHRLEKVCAIDEVEYVNDSKATTAESCVWAVNRINAPIILICGGRDKNIDYTLIVDQLRKKVKKVIVFGEAKDKIASAFEQFIPLEKCLTLEESVQRAKDSASSGECVLFSPMCASFDMFNNYEHRGKVFKQIVKSLG